MKQKTNYWITTDTHFGHDAVKKFCNRPDDFENKIIRGLKINVKENDILIHLGDVAFYKHEYWNEQIMSIKCKKWLLYGNHDKSKSYSWFLSHGWDCVARHIKVELFGKNILFSHIPSMIDNFDLNIHGHFHNTDHRRHEPELNIGNKHILIALEYTNYQPCNLLDVLTSTKDGIYRRG